MIRFVNKSFGLNKGIIYNETDKIQCNLVRQIKNMPKKKSSANVQKTSATVDCKEENKAVTLSNKGGLLIKVLAKPAAKHNAITDISTEGVGVQIAAPPMEGQANSELVKYISKVLSVRKSDVSLEKGSKSRTKILSVSASGLSVDSVMEKLKSEMDSC